MKTEIKMVAAVLLIVLLTVIVFAKPAPAQVFDGRPQPTDFRVTATEGSKDFLTTYTGSACLGCEDRAGFGIKAIEILGGVRYTPDNDDELRFIAKSSLNLNQKIWVTPSFVLDRHGDYTQNVAATIVEGPWQFNTTLRNVTNDLRSQASIGYNLGDVLIVVPGKAFEGGDWFVNGRLLITNKLWLQSRYTFDVEVWQVALFVQWNQGH